MTAFYTTTHEGKTDSRASAGHVRQEYRFAVWVGNDANEWGVSYSRSYELARRRAGAWRCQGYKVSVQPVECRIKLTMRQELSKLRAEVGMPPTVHVYQDGKRYRVNAQ